MIDRYEILQKLATGGMAELFLAKQSGMEGFEKVVVIKRILTHLASDQEFVNMFLDEARIAAKLSHPTIVQIYDLGRADDTYYIAMEYVSGRNVSSILKKAKEDDNRIPVEHTCRIIAGVCDGLYYAHTRKDYDGKPLNIVHRDISPQNILVSFGGGVKLVDFGIAKASTQLAQTRAGVLKGKYSYMSPEQVRGERIDARSDIFAVGIVAYEMLTGQRPFERESSLKTLKAIVQEKPLNPRELNPAISPEVVKILSRALEKDPARRYASAQELQLAMEDWLDKSPAKSNNVRISRFLHELFDDELNTQGATLEVKGIGEIIIPTGASERGAQPIELDEIPEGTVRAALQDIEAAAKAKAASPGEGEGAVARQKSRTNPPPTMDVAAHEASQPTPSGDGDPAEHEELEGGATDELDGATIPVFNLKEYEQEYRRRHEENMRAERRASNTGHAQEAKGAEPSGPIGEAEEFSALPTANVQVAMDLPRNEGKPSVASSSRTPHAGPGTSDNARTPPSSSSHPAPAHAEAAPAEPSKPVAKGASRSDQSVSPADAPPASHNPNITQEVVPGLSHGKVRPPADTRPPVSPRSSSDARIRPTRVEARPRPTASGEHRAEEHPVQDETPPPPANVRTVPVRVRSPAEPASRTPTTPSVPREAGGELVGKRPRAAPPPPSPGGWKKDYGILGLAAAAVLLVGGLVTFLVLPPAGEPVETSSRASGKLKIDTVPANAEIWLNGKKQGVLSPTILGEIPLNTPITVRAAKDGLEQRTTVTLTEKELRMNLLLKLEKPK